jgi:hypothetical protein
MGERHRVDPFLAASERGKDGLVLIRVRLHAQEAGDYLKVVLDSMVHFPKEEGFLLEGRLHPLLGHPPLGDVEDHHVEMRTVLHLYEPDIGLHVPHFPRRELVA